MDGMKVDRVVMVEYWKKHSEGTTIKEMMLDSNAETLNQEEMPEILSYLPDFSQGTVIELGAGIGRFTAVLAKSAKHVVAVDFMEDFVKKNRENNGHLANIDFLQSDVMKLEQAENSADLVFSNWLLMYLTDAEIQQLLLKVLTWLTEDGYLFVRESCNQPSGNITRSFNPTQYRESSLYDALFAAATVPCDEKNVYGFDLIFSKSVDSYIKLKQNRHQVVWLLQKVRRRRDSMHGYRTFQEFLDNQQYSLTGILRYEKIFGRTFISTGGLETTKEFVEMLDLQPGQRVLDVGCGIGGSAFYMVKKYGVKVVAMDLSSNMIRIGQERAQEEQVGPEQVVFEIADATRREYGPQSFDVVYSRDTILHIADKLALFQRFYRWLRPGGKVLISDYCQSEGEHSDVFRAYVKQRGYHLLSPKNYGKVLEQAGFINVRAEDRTEQFTQVLKTELARTEEIRDDFVKEFSQADYDYIVSGWREKIHRVGQGHQRWGLFYAEKP